MKGDTQRYSRGQIPGHTRKPGGVKTVLFAVAAIGLLFLLIESVLWIAGFEFTPGGTTLLRSEDVISHWTIRGLVRDPDLPWSWMPSPGGHVSAPVENPFYYNRQGFRGPAVTEHPEPGVTRIVCLGDSCTLGWGAADSHTWSAQLQQLLDDWSPGQFQVINAGVSGFSSFQGLHYLKTRLLEYHPDMVIVSFNWNDHGDAPDTVPAGSGWIKGGRGVPDADQPSGSAVFRMQGVLARTRTYQLLKKGVMALPGKSEGTEPVESGSPTLRVSPENYRTNMAVIIDMCRDHGIRIMAFTQAANPVLHRGIEPWQTYYSLQDEYNAVLLDLCREKSVPCTDTVPLLSDPDRAETLFLDHVHKRKTGNEIIAGALRERVIL